MSIHIEQILQNAVKQAKKNNDGTLASYIPELAAVPIDYTGIAVMLNNGQRFFAGGDPTLKFTLQSSAKLIVLIGFMEEFGEERVFSYVKTEPSGDDFNSLARLDQFGPKPSNPMLNSGAIMLCCKIPGKIEEHFAWLDKWTERLFGEKLYINASVFASERRTGDRNRSMAYLMKSNGLIEGNIDDLLESYFYLCSYEATLQQAPYLPMLLANQGRAPDGKQIISPRTTRIVNAIMATCGLYNESGRHLVRTGMPAKSGVSGFILAAVNKKAGIAVMSPRVNRKGTSIRGEIMLEYVAEQLDWYGTCPK